MVESGDSVFLFNSHKHQTATDPSNLRVSMLTVRIAMSGIIPTPHSSKKSSKLNQAGKTDETGEVTCHVPANFPVC
jgi:hypothetical protein